MTQIAFLDPRLYPTAVDPWIDARSVGGGVTLTGDEQVIGIGAGLWRYTLSGINLRGAADVREYRRFISALDGRVNTTLVPFYERGRAPWPRDDNGRTITPKMVRRYFLDGTPYADAAGLIDTLIPARLSVGAAAQATTLQIEMQAPTANLSGVSTSLTPSDIVAGHLFTVGSCAYVVTAVTARVGLVSTVTIRPPMRVAVGVGAAVIFTSPVCEMRLVRDDAGRAPLDLLRLASASLEFVEA